MTLNITIISKRTIYQSADFQISRIERGASGEWLELQPNSSKIITLRYPTWSGLLTYCGIGLWNGKRTDQYAAEWLTEAPESAATLYDAIEKIRQRGTAWIKRINQVAGKPTIHSFVLAGYEEGVPTYAIISNYQTLTGWIRPVSNELKVDIRHSANGVHTFVTGNRDAVPRVTRRRLKRLVEIGTAPAVVRRELGIVNELASKSAAAENGISTACLAYSLNMNGGGAGEVHGDVLGPLNPRTMVGGIDISTLFAKIPGFGPNAKLVQSAFATSRSNDLAIREHLNCALHINKRQEPSLPETSAVEEVGSLNDYLLSIQAVNIRTDIVGQIRNPLEALPHAFYWPKGKAIRDLGTFGGSFSNALSVNDSGQVVGAAHVDQSTQRAFLWDESDGMRDLGTLGGRNSVATSINNSCQIVGSSYIGGGEPNQQNERAFLWTPADGMINVGSQFKGWSRAVAINSRGLVLGWRLRGAVICGFVWSPEFGVRDIVGEGEQAFYPSAINDSGFVVGEGDDRFGKRRAFSWSREEGLRQFPVADNFHPTDVDKHGNVVGNVNSRPWNRPYLYRTTTRGFLALPFAEEHNTSVKAINGEGVIVGAASTESWKHSHPLIWRVDITAL